MSVSRDGFSFRQIQQRNSMRKEVFFVPPLLWTPYHKHHRQADFLLHGTTALLAIPHATCCLFMSRGGNIFFVPIIQVFLNFFYLDWCELQIHSWLHRIGQKDEMGSLVKLPSAHTRLFVEKVVTYTKFVVRWK